MTALLDDRVCIVAEIGSNHDGSLTRAQSLIREAARDGADAVKFQLYRADELYPGTITPGAIPDDWLPILQRTAHDCGAEFFCSVFSIDTLNAYLEIDPPAVKIASPEATDYDLLYAASCTGLPVICATGACTVADVDAVSILLEDCDHVLLHCVSAYPAPGPDMNLRVIPWMRDRYRVPVGLSDHSLHPSFAPVVAAAAGACMVEKHFTYSRQAKGPDHGFALEPDQFRRMVTEVRAAEVILGDGVKRVMACEDPTDRRAIRVAA